MTTTKTLNPVYTLVERDGETIGRVTNLGNTYRASRKTGTREDMRRVSQGFRSIDAAVRWIEQA